MPRPRRSPSLPPAIMSSTAAPFRPEGWEGAPTASWPTSSRWRSISYSGNCVSFIGDAKVNGQLGYQFTFGACDFSASGGIGGFSIAVTGPAGYSYHKNSNLTTGFVKLFQPVQP